VSPISSGGAGIVRASHRGYSRIGIGHQRTVQLGGGSLLVIDEVHGDEVHGDEVHGADEHLLDLQYVLGPAWRASSEMMSGKTVSCVITGPQRLTLQCESESSLTLSLTPAEISREYGATIPVSCIRIQTTACLPAKVQTRVQWD
jgi:hypothetical protein